MQRYETHAHRPLLWVVGLLCWIAALTGVVGWALGRTWGTSVALTGLLGASGVALAIGRVYVRRLQDRIILLEMRVRTASLLTPTQQAQLAALPKSRVVALRFAPDDELPALLDRAVAENLSADAIKRAVRNWRADELRT